MAGNTIDENILVGLSYIPLGIIVIGVVFNTFTFLVLIINLKFRKMSSMLFLSFIAISDTLTLFTWNLNHFLQPNKLPRVESVSVAACRFFNFLQYFSLQTSGLLYCMISVDRYFTIVSLPGSCLKKAFGSPRSAYIWTIGIVIGVAVLNCHTLFMQGYYKTKYLNVTSLDNTTFIKETKEVACFESEDKTYQLNPMWDYANLVIYNFIPFIIMAIFNTLLIMKTFSRIKATTATKEKTENKRRRRLTISLFIITVGFLLMTLPGSIVYGFFYDTLRPTYVGHAILIACDCFLFTQHAIIFFMCFATNSFFRTVILNIFRTSTTAAANEFSTIK